jgi:hypothetical protein
MKLSPITLSLISVASSAYPDDAVAGLLSPNTGELFAPFLRDPAHCDDTLAQFIAIEIADVTRGESNPVIAAREAERAIRRAAEELTQVADKLRYEEARLC